MKTVPHLFADIMTRAEDMAAVAMEGQRRDNSPDMQQVLCCHLRMVITAMDGIVGEIKHRLGDAHD